MGTLGTLVGELGGDEAEFRAKMEAVTVFMHDHNVPKDLKLKIRKYYDYSFSNPYVEVSSSDLGAYLYVYVFVIYKDIQILRVLV